jgi:hypothetical protein
MAEQTEQHRRGIIIATVVVVAALLAVLGVFLLRDDSDEVVGDASTTTTSSPATTTASRGTDAPAATTTPTRITDGEASRAVWPDPDGTVRYNDPVDVARAFAEELAGFTDPIVGDFMEGDSRSGEVEVRAARNGPVSTVLVRRFTDDTWWVLGSTTPDIELDDPVAGQAIDAPLQLSGRARAFEGTVQVEVFERGDTSPRGEGFVTGSGSDELGPFSGEVAWDNPGGGWGVVLLTTRGGEDDRVWQATAVPVGFIGGD